MVAVLVNGLSFTPTLGHYPDRQQQAQTIEQQVNLLRAYVGDDQSPQGTLRVYREQDQLHVSGGGAVFDLVPLSDTAFILLGDDTAFDEVPAEFRRDPNGSMGFYLGGARFGSKP